MPRAQNCALKALQFIFLPTLVKSLGWEDMTVFEMSTYKILEMKYKKIRP